MSHLIPENFDFSPSGHYDPLFLYADGARANGIRAARAVSEANRHRLVKAPKSPTPENLLEKAFAKQKFQFNALKLKHCESNPERAVIHEHEFCRVKTPTGATGASAIIEYREWAEEWRVRSQIETTSGNPPPDQDGPRESELLSERGARKIAESCEYMHLQKGGFKTFVTGTFTEEKREEIANGKTTIQREVSRTMDALQKIYQRGWTKRDGTRVEGHSEGLPYLWVVEIPKNDAGEDNPHIHMLLGWRVAYADFEEWSERIESIWGNGYFHLEKIKDSECAGAYMAKAAGYLCKAADMETQGKVRGNRYGISTPARAPDWVTLTKAQLHSMGQLIADIYDHLTVTYGEKFSERKRLNRALSNTEKTEKEKRQKIGKRLAKVREELKKIPVRCNKYQIVLKGKSAFYSFMTWAVQPEDAEPVEWLPEMQPGWEWKRGDEVTPKDSHFFRKLGAVMRGRKFWRRLKVPQWMIDQAENLNFWHTTKRDYEIESQLSAEFESCGFRFGIL